MKASHAGGMPVRGPGWENASVRETRSGGGSWAAICRWLREPLVLFLLIGGGLFALYGRLHPDAFQAEADTRIVITEDDMRQMSVQWVAQGRPPPTAAQWQSLIEHKEREEVLYREALALGLDRDDTIVKRRMVQKMDFLAEDLAALMEPTSDLLRDWFEQHRERFILPPRVSFRHVYFSPDLRGSHAADDARQVLDGLAGEPAESPAAVGDPFMFQDFYGDREAGQVAAEFGPPFAQRLLELPPGRWQGPIESGYGWHLVFTESLTPARLPAIEEVEEDVRRAWMEERRAEAKDAIYQAMRSKYQLELPASVLVTDQLLGPHATAQ